MTRLFTSLRDSHTHRAWPEATSLPAVNPLERQAQPAAMRPALRWRAQPVDVRPRLRLQLFVTASLSGTTVSLSQLARASGNKSAQWRGHVKVMIPHIGGFQFTTIPQQICQCHCKLPKPLTSIVSPPLHSLFVFSLLCSIRLRRARISSLTQTTLLQGHKFSCALIIPGSHLHV